MVGGYPGAHFGRAAGSGEVGGSEDESDAAHPSWRPRGNAYYIAPPSARAPRDTQPAGRRGAGRARRQPTAGHSGILPRAQRGPRGRDNAGTRLLSVILSYSRVRTVSACAARLGLSHPVALRARASLVPTVGRGRRSGGRAATRQSARRCASAQGQHQRNAHRRGGGGGGGARTSHILGGCWWPAAQGGTVRPAHQRNGRCVSYSTALPRGGAEEGPWGGPSSRPAREGGPPLGPAGQGRDEGSERLTGAARLDVSVHSML